MTYLATRRLVVAGGVVALAILAAILYVRRVETVEVAAVLLFIPVFVAAAVWRLTGGVVAGALAAVGYAALRAPAVQAIGASSFTGLIATRAVGYLLFGALGGWAVQQLRYSLEKLDIYDNIDDATSLFNSRFFLQDTDLEMARATRYQTLFSVCVVDIPVGAVDPLPRRRREGLLRDLGAQLQAAVRTVDRAVHGRTAAAHRFAVICPETGFEGASVFTSRLAQQVDQFLAGRGVTVPTPGIAHIACTFPDERGAEVLAGLRADFAAVEETEHPEHPRTT